MFLKILQGYQQDWEFLECEQETHTSEQLLAVDRSRHTLEDLNWVLEWEGEGGINWSLSWLASEIQPRKCEYWVAKSHLGIIY